MKLCLAKAGFKPWKFIFNSAKLWDRIRMNQSLLGSSIDPRAIPQEHRALAVLWSPLSDQLIFNFRSFAETLCEGAPTNGSVVGLTANMYDPLVLLSPLTNCFKIMLQQLCRTRLKWDDQFTDEFLDQLRLLICNLCLAKPSVVPSYILLLNGKG